MTDRIRIDHLRLDAATTIDSGGMNHGKALVDPDELLALVEAVEAAEAFVVADAERGPRLVTADLNPYSHRGRLETLRETLARFDFGDDE